MQTDKPFYLVGSYRNYHQLDPLEKRLEAIRNREKRIEKIKLFDAKEKRKILADVWFTHDLGVLCR